jgi:DNA-binding winged helix-turn-helix (wHTH) protein/tetratricopeptide (TPR) repeat protein
MHSRMSRVRPADDSWRSFHSVRFGSNLGPANWRTGSRRLFASRHGEGSVAHQRETSRQRYRFGEFLLDPASRELRRGIHLLTLSPKVFDCINYLIEHRERAVGRDELIAAVWGRADVSDIQLNQLIRKVRLRLHDKDSEQDVVRTVPRFGFRWVLPITIEAGTDLESTSSSNTPPIARNSATEYPQSPRAAMDRFRVAAVVALSLAVVSGGIYWYAHRGSPRTSTAELPVSSATTRAAADVVVLPVEIPADDPDWAWMRLGLMDQIGSRVRNAGIAVVPSDNVVALARHAVAADDDLIDKAQQATGARYVAQPIAIHSDGGWMLRVELHGSGDLRRDIGAQAADPIKAAHSIADQLVVALGGHPQPGSIESNERLQRIDAALLGDDFASAQALIESAPASLRDTVEMRFYRARLNLTQGHFQEAADALTQLIAGMPAETAPALRANFFRVLGVTSFRRGQPDAAERQLTEAVSALENLNEPALLGKAYIDRGGARLLEGHQDEAAADLSQARVVLEPTGDVLALAWIDLNEGALQSMRGHYAEALPLFERAEATFKRFSAQRQLTTALGNEIDAHLQLLVPDQALSASSRGLENAGTLATDPGFRFQRLRALIANGRIGEARNLINEASAEKDAVYGAPVRSLEAKLDLDAGNSDRALQIAEHVIAELSEYQAGSMRASTWLLAIHALRSMQRDDDAAAEVAKLVAFANGTDIPDVRVFARLAEAESAWSAQRRDESVRLYDDALRQANATGIPASVAEVAVSYGNALIDHGDLAGASAVAGQVARWANRDFGCALLQARLYRALGEREPWRVALERARALAGERAIPATVISPPKDALISSLDGSQK